MHLYHYIAINQDSNTFNSPNNALKEGLNHQTRTGYYTNGGNLFPELTEKLRPTNVESWVDFNNAFGAQLGQPEQPYLTFPLTTNKILVFNRDLSSDLFAYIEDQYMKQETGGGYFTVGLPSKEELVMQYWASMLILDDYLKMKPYKDAELLIFTTVPPELLEYRK
ncbi:hypothetical protein CSE16_10265 [Solibacillus sp. R5-41]|uniref:hypothetical protein n=1 Tax=Solibacillus sp. R5-41 TaxID=2048654 RepID=UPI000C1252BB|nr:hypothetical protein [Solibacillus sp. R5-41]ATP40401.1 hypothetical protein CSE16_10265 [Solibacillus sp. R5-41]